MVAPLVLAKDHQQALDAIQTYANRDMLTLYGSAFASKNNWQTATNEFEAGFKNISKQYTSIAGRLAMGYYTASRLNAIGLSTTPGAAQTQAGFYTPTLAVINPTKRVESTLGYGFKKIWEGATRAEATKIFSGGLNQTVHTASRETLKFNGQKDNFSAKVVIVPSTNACAFCLEAATYWWTSDPSYASTVNQTWHDNCKCVASVAFKNQNLTQFRDQRLEEYQEQKAELSQMIKAGEIETALPSGSTRWNNENYGSDKPPMKGTTEYAELIKNPAIAALQVDYSNQKQKDLLSLMRSEFGYK